MQDLTRDYESADVCKTSQVIMRVLTFSKTSQVIMRVLTLSMTPLLIKCCLLAMSSQSTTPPARPLKTWRNNYAG